MKVIESKIRIEFTLEEIAALRKLLGENSLHTYTKLGLDVNQSQSLRSMYAKLPEIITEAPNET